VQRRGMRSARGRGGAGGAQNATRESLSAMYTAWILCNGLLILHQIAVEKIWMTNRSDFGSSEFKDLPRCPCYCCQAEMA